MSIPPFSDSYRASGVLLHVTSLPSPYGIGDVGPAAVAWVDRLQEAGQRWWQALPLGPTGYGDSPYQSLSSFACNGLLISPESLAADGLLHELGLEAKPFPSGPVNYGVVISFKHQLLNQLWASFKAGVRKDLRPAYERFCYEQAHWLEDYALFRALKKNNDGISYLKWPTGLVKRDAAAITQSRKQLSKEVDQVRFAQFVIFRQAQRLKEYA